MKNSVMRYWQIEEWERNQAGLIYNRTCSLSGCCFLIKEDNILWNQADLLYVVWLHLLEVFLNHLVNMVQDSIFTYQSYILYKIIVTAKYII